MIACPQCRTACPTDARFCPACGAALPRRACAACGRDNMAGARFCVGCGGGLDGSGERPSAERRQITALFADLVGSTALAERLEPEDYRELIVWYHETAARMIEGRGGRVAQFLGDGVLAYFGYPEAEEGAAVRAVLSAIDIVDAARARPLPGLGDGTERLAIRAGAHTGVVVVDLGAPEREAAAFGGPLNVAAHLQAFAPRNGIVVGEATARLIEGTIALEPLGRHTLKQADRPMAVFRVLGREAARPGRQPARLGGRPLPLVGRERELSLLRAVAAASTRAPGHVVLVRGEAGIGKSRLVAELRRMVGADGSHWLDCACSAFDQDSALLPVAAMLRGDLGVSAGADPARDRRHLRERIQARLADEPDAEHLLARFLDLPPDPAEAARTIEPATARRRLFRILVRWIEEEARRRPVILLVEDLHWADASTSEFLTAVVAAAPRLPLLVLMTQRDGPVPSWLARATFQQIGLERLADDDAARLVAETAGAALAMDDARAIIARADGNPLFLEELARSAMEAEAEAKSRRGQPLAAGHVPTSLRDSLMARLDRLGPAKRVAELAAVVGRTIPVPLLEAVWDGPAPALHAGLAALAAANLLIATDPGGQPAVRFRHAILQDLAYDSLVRRDRARLHDRLATAIEAQFPQLVQTQPERLAEHCWAAGRNEAAARHWLSAGRRAIERSANREAVAQLRRALEAATAVEDDGARARAMLEARLAMGPPLLALEGWSAPEVEECYATARALALEAGDARGHFRALRGLFNVHLLRGRIADAEAAARALRALAEEAGDPDLVMESERPIGMTLFFAGRFRDALAHLDRSLALHDPERHGGFAYVYGADPAVVGQSVAALAGWFAGDEVRAVCLSEAAIARADALAHPFSRGYALSLGATLRQLRGEADEARRLATLAIDLAIAHDYPYWVAWGEMVRGWALAKDGRAAEGIEAIRRGLQAYAATGAEQMRPYGLTLLAEACLDADRIAEGLAAVETALACGGSGEIRFYAAESHRIEARLRAAAGDPAGAARAGAAGLALAAAQDSPTLAARFTEVAAGHR